MQTLKPRLKTQSTSRLKVVEVGSWGAGLSASERGYDSRWQKAREGWLRAHPLCVMCDRATPATVVDHKVAHRGDKVLFWDKNNWQSLCKKCHDSHAQRRDNKKFLDDGI